MSTPQFVTNSAADWAAQYTTDSARNVREASLAKGHQWLKRAGVQTTSDDMAFLAYECWRGMSDLERGGDLNDDYLVAGDVLDENVTDHDAELLCQLVPLVPQPEVGGMSREVTAVHTALLLVVGEMRERWEDKS